MSVQRVTVDIVTPNWQYCDCQDPYNKNKANGERCRFCQEIKKRGQGTRYFCTLFNNELVYKNGAVERTSLCYCTGSSNFVIDATREPITNSRSSNVLSPKEVVKIVRRALKSVQNRANDLYNRGFPAIQALDAAISQELDEWKDALR